MIRNIIGVAEIHHRERDLLYVDFYLVPTWVQKGKSPKLLLMKFCSDIQVFQTMNHENFAVPGFLTLECPWDKCFDQETRIRHLKFKPSFQFFPVATEIYLYPKSSPKPQDMSVKNCLQDTPSWKKRLIKTLYILNVPWNFYICQTLLKLLKKKWLKPFFNVIIMKSLWAEQEPAREAILYIFIGPQQLGTVMMEMFLGEQLSLNWIDTIFVFGVWHDKMSRVHDRLNDHY